MFGNSQSLCPSWLWTVANGPVVFFDMAGCLVLVLLVVGILGLLLVSTELVEHWSDVLVLILLMTLASGMCLISGRMLMTLLWRWLTSRMFGLMGEGRITGCTCLLQNLLWMVLFGVLLRVWSGAC